MPRIILGLIGIVLPVSACAQTGGVPASAAESCTWSGGVWRPALETCERSTGGGGGY